MRRGERDTLNLTLIAASYALLMVLPLVTTFDDFLTGWALQLGANNPLQSIVPVEARMVVGLRARSWWWHGSSRSGCSSSDGSCRMKRQPA